MALSLVRPKVADIEFRLYDRPLHPELFEPVAEKTVTAYTLVREGGA